MNRMKTFPISLLAVLALVLALVRPAFAAEEPVALRERLTNDSTSRLYTVPHDAALQAAVQKSDLKNVVVLHDGWRETVPSFARLKIDELTGRDSLHGQDPEFTILSMIYQNDLWYDAKIFPLEHPDLQTLLGVEGKWVSARDVAGNANIGKLIDEIGAAAPVKEELEKLTKTLNAVEQAHQLGPEQRVLAMYEADGIDAATVKELFNDKEKLRAKHKHRNELIAQLDTRKPYLKAGEKLLERVRLLTQIPDQFLVVPDTAGAETKWIRPAALASGTPLVEAARAFDDELAKAFATNAPEAIEPATRAFLDLVQRSREYPSQRYRDLQNFYVTRNPWKVASGFYLLSAVVFGLHLFFRRRQFYITGLALFAIGFLFNTGAVVIRGYLTGHVPVSNLYESVTFVSWSAMAISLVCELWNRKGLVGVGASVVGFLLLTGAGLFPLHESRIHPLRAVLNSYWLNIHVTMMLISYSAFAISAFFAGLFLVRNALGREALFGQKAVMTQIQVEEFCYRLVQLGWPILTFGIALGAVWADTAWGRFWGWDPKETWAFITWVGYTVYLHSRMVMGWRGRWSAAACLLGFVLVLITWLGVSYLPIFSGGLHSYASPNTY